MPDGIKADEVKTASSTEDPGRPTTRITWRHLMLGPVIFLYISSVHMSLFTNIQYLYRRVQMEEYPNKTFDTGSSFCTKNLSDLYRQTRVQEKVSQYIVLFSIVGGVPAFFVNILLGAYMDRYGRKFAMILAMTGNLLRLLVCFIGVYTQMKLQLFAIAFLLDGLCGVPFIMLQAVFSSLSDITTRKNRAVGFVLAEVCLGLGSSLPTFAVGYFIQANGFKDPYILCITCSVVAMLLAIFVLPETFPKERRAKKSETCMNLKQAVGFYFSSSNAGQRWKYNIVIIVFFLTMADQLGRNNVETLYQMNVPFCWTPTKLGWYGALRAGLPLVFAMLLVTILRKFLAEESIAMVGCVSYLAGFILEAMANTDVVIYIVTVVGSCGVLTLPMSRVILSRMTSPQKQGALNASMAAVEATCSMFAHLLTTAIYKNTVKDFGGTVFLVMASFNGLALVLLTILKVGSRGDKEKQAIDDIVPVAVYKKSSTNM